MTMPSVRASERASTGTPVERGKRDADRHQALNEHLVDPGADAAWSIISYILSGILFWGVLGWWLDGLVFDPSSDTTLFLPAGVLIGTAAGGYLGYMRFLQRTQRRPDQ